MEEVMGALGNGSKAVEQSTLADLDLIDQAPLLAWHRATANGEIAPTTDRALIDHVLESIAALSKITIELSRELDDVRDAVRELQPPESPEVERGSEGL
jgi:hypothetical protein